jgi:hypothetical protein
MARYVFNDLPRVVRERIVQITAKANEKDPRILLLELSWGSGWFKYVMLVASLGVLAFCAQYLVERGHSGIHPRHDEEAFYAIAGAVFVGVVAAAGIAIRYVWKPPPYREGLWVFPSGLCKLDGGHVEFRPIAELPRPTLVTVRRNGRYSNSRLELGHPFTFTFWNHQAAEQATSTVLGAKQRMIALHAAGETAAIAQFDPFYECTLSGNWVTPAMANTEGPKAAIVPSVVRWAQWLGGLALGVLAAGGAYAFFSVAFKHRL